MSQNVKEVHFFKPLFLPWEVDLLTNDRSGAYFEYVEIAKPPPKTLLEIRVDARSGEVVYLVFSEKGGKRSIVYPAIQTWQLCEKSDIEIASPFNSSRGR